MPKQPSNSFWHWYLVNRLWLHGGFLSLLFLVNCFWGGMVWVVYPCLMLLLLVETCDNALSLILFTVPFAWLSLNTGLVWWLGCVLVAVIKFVITVILQRQRRWYVLPLLAVGIFVVYCLLPFGAYNTNLVIKLGMFLVMFVVLGVLIMRPSLIRLKFNLRVMTMALVLASLFSLLRPVSLYLQETFTEHFTTLSDGTSIFRFQALFAHPNNLGMMCILVEALLAYIIISKQASWLDYGAMLLVTVIGYFTLSKAFLLLTALTYVVVIIYLMCYDWKKTTVGLVVLITVTLTVYGIFTEAVNWYLLRFTDHVHQGDDFASIMSALTTARWDLWVTYTQYLGTNPGVLWFGRGLGASALHDPRSDQTLSAHNFFISSLYELGIVGTLLLFTGLFFMIRELCRTKNTKIHHGIWLPVVIFTLLLCVEDFILIIV